jgi:drug/metabolite transporter (DMT)-like permease
MSAGLQMAWGGGFLFLLSTATGELRLLPSLYHRWNWHLALAMAYLILPASIIAFRAFVWLIARDPATRVASYAYVNPVVALASRCISGARAAHAPAVRGSFPGAGGGCCHARRQACRAP